MILSDSQVKKIREKLNEIKDKRGPYNQDNHLHAINVIDANAERASEILKIMEEVEKIERR